MQPREDKEELEKPQAKPSPLTAREFEVRKPAKTGIEQQQAAEPEAPDEPDERPKKSPPRKR